MKLIFILSAALMATVSAKPCKRNTTLIPVSEDTVPKPESFLKTSAQGSTQPNVVPVAFGTPDQMSSSSSSLSVPKPSPISSSAFVPPVASPTSATPSSTPSGGVPITNTTSKLEVAQNQGGSISCPAGFMNVVFNTDASSEGDLQSRFATIQAHGANDWIGFTMTPYSGIMGSNQIPILMDPRTDNMQAANTAIQGGSAPQYLEIFNEPDFSFDQLTLVSTPQAAASAFQSIMDVSTTTTFISPAIAYTASSWLEDFFTACNCEDKFPIIASHIYDVDPQSAIQQIQMVHGRYPDKKLWLTELAPASSPSQGCTLDASGIASWMTTVVTFAAQSGYVEKIFWNNGEYNPTFGNTCNPSLTNEDGSPSTILSTYAGLCGTPSGSVPTS